MNDDELIHPMLRSVLANGGKERVDRQCSIVCNTINSEMNVNNRHHHYNHNVRLTIQKTDTFSKKH